MSRGDTAAVAQYRRSEIAVEEAETTDSQIIEDSRVRLVRQTTSLRSMEVAMKKLIPFHLAQARAYWRIAARFARLGQWTQSEHYRNVAERHFREYRHNQQLITARAK